MWEAVLRKSLLGSDLDRIAAAIDLAEAGGAELQLVESARTQFLKLSEDALLQVLEQEEPDVQSIQLAIERVDTTHGCRELLARAHHQLRGLTDNALDADVSAVSLSEVLVVDTASRSARPGPSTQMQLAEEWRRTGKLPPGPPSLASESTGVTSLCGDQEVGRGDMEVHPDRTRSTWRGDCARSKEIYQRGSDEWSNTSSSVAAPLSSRQKGPPPAIFGRRDLSEDDLEAQSSLAVLPGQRTAVARPKAASNSECSLQ